jgi:glucan 1,3-beta-glucosidase
MLRFQLSFAILIFSIQVMPLGLSGQGTREIEKLKWINFGPYTEVGQNPGGTIPEAQIIALLDSIQPYVEGIRTYGTQNGLEKIPLLAKQRGLKVMVGIFLSGDILVNNAQVAKGIEIGNAGNADMLIVGGEVLYNNFLTPSQLIGYINQVKDACPTIPVTTADVHRMLIEHPDVVNACDFVFPNIYPYYEGQPVECAMQWFDQAYESLLPVANGKEIIISETGWKTSGPIVGEAIPSFQNALRYHREMLDWSEATGVEVTFFEAFDEPWKIPLNDDGWGIFFNDATLKPGMDSLFLPNEPIENTWSCHEAPDDGSDTLILDYIPVLGSSDNIKGHINDLNTCDYNIAAYIKVGGGWWTKPTFDMPVVTVFCNGQWRLDYTGGGNDPLATDMCFFIVENDYTPPACSGCGSIPQDIYDYAIASKCIQRYLLTDVSASATDQDICEGGSTTLTGEGGSQYLWSTGQTGATVQVFPTITTTYSVTITDGTGGGAITTVTVNVLSKPNFTIAATPDTIETGSLSILHVTGAGSISFLWSTGETTRTIEVQPLTTTTYTVTATCGNGCIEIDSITVVVNPITSTNTLKSISSVNVYPKPASHVVHVSLVLEDSKPVTLSVFNQTGTLIAQKWEQPINGLLHSQFDVTTIPMGLYFLMIRTTQGEIRVEKILVRT